ncbi:MAG: hypothetical protein ACI9YB_003160, partial [Halioglobus sp.]
YTLSREKRGFFLAFSRSKNNTGNCCKPQH